MDTDIYEDSTMCGVASGDELVLRWLQRVRCGLSAVWRCDLMEAERIIGLNRSGRYPAQHSAPGDAQKEKAN